MKEWARRQLDQLCNEVGDLFSPTFGVTPTTEHYGDAAFEGTSTALARADHVHGMPDAPESTIDDLATFTLFFDDLVLSSPTNVFQTTGASSAVGGRDDIGALGAFGSVDVLTNASLNTSASIFARNDSATTLTARHLWQRTIKLNMRAAVPIASAGLISCFAWVGAIGAFAYATGVRIDNVLTDGVYFSLATDGAGAGNWFANARSSGTTTSVDTGRAPIVNGASVEFMIFEINYDHPTTTATFYIGDSTHVDDGGTPILDLVATISTNVPSSARKLGGFGMWIQNGATVARSACLDNIFIKGYRVAPA